ncbi:MAG: RnfABCDGE type electron transport complex subunit G [Candidatus Neomarinimicrobiota bacterium]
MNNTAKIIVVLTIISIISGGVLAVLDSFTRPRIEDYAEKVKNAAIYDVLPESVKVEVIKVKIDDEEREVYKAIKKNEVVAYAFQVSGSGFQSDLVLMVGVSPDFSELNSLKILSQMETPGLGTRIEEEWFIEQFKGLKLKPSVTYIKNAKPSKDNEIQAITGATISSAAIVDILNTEINKVRLAMNK